MTLAQQEPDITSGHKAETTKKIIASHLEKTDTIRIGNDLDLMPDIVNEILVPIMPICSPDDIRALKISLLEIITNAIEHGNLSIGYTNKTILYGEKLDELIKKRQSKEPFKSRKVTIKCRVNADNVTYIITDQGDGFDWRNLLNPTKEENALMPHGRGIFMARSYMDMLSFNKKGNRVTMMKICNYSATKAQRH